MKALECPCCGHTEEYAVDIFSHMMQHPKEDIVRDVVYSLLVRDKNEV